MTNSKLGNIGKDNAELIEEFLVKVSEMYHYNLEQYPEENPTMIGAFCEIIDEIKRGKYAWFKNTSKYW